MKLWLDFLSIRKFLKNNENHKLLRAAVWPDGIVREEAELGAGAR